MADKHLPRSNNQEKQAKNQQIIERGKREIDTRVIDSEALYGVDRTRQPKVQPSPLRESWGNDANRGGIGTQTSISANDQEKLRQQQREKRSSGLLGNFVKKASSHPQGNNGTDLRRSGSSGGSGGLAKKLRKRRSELGPVDESG